MSLGARLQRLERNAPRPEPPLVFSAEARALHERLTADPEAQSIFTAMRPKFAALGLLDDGWRRRLGAACQDKECMSLTTALRHRAAALEMEAR